MSQAAQCSGTKLGSCSARAEWDVISSYANTDNPLGGPEFDSTCDEHLAETLRWVMSWHGDTGVTVEPHAFAVDALPAVQS